MRLIDEFKQKAQHANELDVQKRVPGVRVSRSDVMRYALQNSASNIPADTLETIVAPTKLSE
jgi:hypothetical protein